MGTLHNIIGVGVGALWKKWCITKKLVSVTHKLVPETRNKNNVFCRPHLEPFSIHLISRHLLRLQGFSVAWFFPSQSNPPIVSHCGESWICISALSLYPAKQFQSQWYPQRSIHSGERGSDDGIYSRYLSLHFVVAQKICCFKIFSHWVH